MNDPIYKRLFSFGRMVADLLRAVGHPDWLGEVDFDTLDKLPAEYVGDMWQQRRGDTVWRVRFRGDWLYLLVLLEFQSEKDLRMPLRNLEYTALLYGELDKRDELGRPGRWPPVLPVVLCNGETPWVDTLEMRDLFGAVPESLAPYQPSQRSLVLDERRVAVERLPRGNLMRGVVGFEQSRTPDALARAARALEGWLRHPADADLGLVFRDWMAAMVERLAPGKPPNLGRTLKEATMTLGRIEDWPKQFVAQGRVEGQRIVLHRLATRRFGDAVGDQLNALLDGTDDWERIAAVTDLIATADAGADLIDGVTEVLRPAADHD